MIKRRRSKRVSKINFNKSFSHIFASSVNFPFVPRLLILWFAILFHRCRTVKKQPPNGLRNSKGKRKKKWTWQINKNTENLFSFRVLWSFFSVFHSRRDDEGREEEMPEKLFHLLQLEEGEEMKIKELLFEENK